jgi:hypothetical protein
MIVMVMMLMLIVTVNFFETALGQGRSSFWTESREFFGQLLQVSCITYTY